MGYLIDVDSRLHAAIWRTRPQFAHRHQQLHPDDDIASLSFKLLSALSLHSSGFLFQVICRLVRRCASTRPRPKTPDLRPSRHPPRVKQRRTRNADAIAWARFYAPFLRSDTRHLRSWLHHCSMGSGHTPLRARHLRLGLRCRREFPRFFSCADSPILNNARPQTRAARGFGLLTLIYLAIFIPVERLATREANLVRPLPTRYVESMLMSFCRQHPRSPAFGISAREQLRRRGSF